MTPEPFIPAVGWVAPFASILVAIATFPLWAPRAWESNLRKLAVSAAVSLPVVILYWLHSPSTLLHTAWDYVSFIVLQGSLFTIAGGILVTGDIEATPRGNTGFLALGAVLASLIGTTGAS